MKYFFSGFCLLLSFLALRANAQKYDYPMPAPIVTSDSSAGRLKCILGGHEDDITDASWSPDSKYVVTCSRDQSAMVWEAATGKRIFTLFSTEEIHYVSWSKDGTKIATSSDFPLIDLWDAKSGNKLLHLDGRSFAWSPDGTSFSYFTLDYTLRILDASSFATLHTISLKNKLIYSAYWSPDSKNIACNATDSSVVVLDVAAESMVYSVALQNKFTKDIHWNSESTRIIIAIDSSFLTVDGKTGMLLSTTTIPNSQYWRPIVWSNDGNRVAFCGDSLQVWDTQPWTKLYSASGHIARIRSISWSPDDKQFVSASDDKSAIIWDATTGNKLFTLLGHRSEVNVVRWSKDGTRILSGGSLLNNPINSSKNSGDFTAIIWDAKSGALIHRMMPHNSFVWDYAWHPDGTKIASASADSTVIVWDIATNDTVRIFRGHKSNVYAVGWSPNGTMLYSASTDSTTIIWNSNTGSITSTFHPQSRNTKLGWNPSSDKVYTTSSTNTSIWDVSTGNMLVYFPNFTNGASWSPDGSKFASIGKDTIIIWDATTWVEYLRIIIPSHSNTSVNWSPDGSRIALQDNSTLKIWDMQSKAILFTIPNQAYSLSRIQWSSDGSEFSLLSYNSTTLLTSPDFYNSQTGLKVRSFPDSIALYPQQYLSPNASRFIGVQRDSKSQMNTITVRDTKTGKEKLLLPLHTYDYPNEVTWSPTGKYIASSYRSTIKVWMVEEVNSVVESLPVLQSTQSPFSLYPNPTDNILHLHCTTTSAITTTVRVLNLLGQEMLTTQVPAAVNEWTLPMSHLPTGVYLVEWNGAVQKVVVH